MRSVLRRAGLAIAVGALACAAAAVFAQNTYPTKPVRLVVPFAAGGSADIVAEPVSTLDLMGTFLDYADAPQPRDIQSRSLRALLEGRPETRDVAYSEWYVHPSRCGVALKLRTVCTKTHKCTFELESGAGELYDLVNDPHEMNNVFDDPGYATVRKELYDVMRARPGRVREVLPEPIAMS